MEKTLYHVWLFFLGLVYYLIVPAIVAASKIWENYPGIDLLYSYYKDEYLFGYFFLILLIAIPYIIGAYLPVFCYKKISRPILQIIISSKGLFIISIPMLLYSQYVIVANRGYMFQGYLAEIDVPFVGTLATVNMVVLFLFIYNKLGDYSKTINKLLAFILIELCVVVLGLGTRMYVMVTIFSLFVFLLDQKIVTIKKMLLWLSLIIVLVLAVGIWRMGGSHISYEQMMYIGVAEPTFTWISAISMYDLNELPLIAFPSNFISSFINFIPSSLLPDKSELISELSLNYYSPFGATSVLLSLISNFGILGSMIALFCLGFLLTQIRLRWLTVFGQSYYYCVCGIIPFQLFRDDMGIVNKQIISNLLLVPIMFFTVHRIMSLLATKIDKAPTS